MNDAILDPTEPIHEPRLWRANGWTARVIKNEDDEGWAVAMVKSAPGPWAATRRTPSRWTPTLSTPW
jgi:hypothetical protein